MIKILIKVKYFWVRFNKVNSKIRNNVNEINEKRVFLKFLLRGDNKISIEVKE